MSIEQMFQQMYYNDFNEKVTQVMKTDGNIEQLSKNNKRFLEILGVDIHKENVNHYKVGTIAI